MSYIQQLATLYYAVLIGADSKIIDQGPLRATKAQADLDALNLVTLWS